MPRVGANPRAIWAQQYGLRPEDLVVDLDDQAGGELLPDTFELGPDGEVYEAEGEVLPPEGSQAHHENLAPRVPEQYLNQLADELIELVEMDIEERAPWRDRYRRGLEMMGLIESDIDDGAFPGASTAVHPLLVEAITQFWARAMAELFPAEGPAKGKVLGAQTQQKIARAERVAEYMNYEITTVDKGYIPGKSRLMWAVPAQGCGFTKTYRDPVLDRTVTIYVPAEDLIVPSEATDLATAPRFTHRMKKTKAEVKRLQLVGFYRDIELQRPAQEDRDEVTELNLEAVDVAPDDNEEDVRHEIYEVCVDLDLPGFEHQAEGRNTGLEVPYIVSIDKYSRKVLSIYRNYDEKDPLCRRKVYFTKYGFVPGFGFYDFGFFHLIGGLQRAATGALRALLDSAATASLSGGFVAKNANLKGQKLVMEPGVWKAVSASSQDLKNAFFSPPVKEPSPALFQLLGFLTEAAQRFSATTELQVGETNRNQPVGTTLALIEQGQKVMSTIHRLMHASLAEELRLRYELAREFAPAEGYPYDVAGVDRTVFREDFKPDVEVVPISDPNVFSSVQRLSIAQLVYQVALENPDMVPRRKAIMQLFQAAKVPDVEDLVEPEAEPKPYDPNGEIQALLMGKPIMVMPEQPHVEHLKVLWAFATNPQFGAHPQVMEQIGPSIASVIGQHLAYAWAAHVRGNQIPVGFMDPTSGEVEQPEAPPEVVAQLMAEISPMLAQVPGLPAPVEGGQGPDAGLEAEKQKLQLKAQDHEQELRHREEKHKQDLKFKEEQHGLKTMADIEKHTVDVQKKIDDATLTQAEREQRLAHEQASRALDQEIKAATAQMDIETQERQAAIAESQRRSEAMARMQERQMGLADKQQDFALRSQDRQEQALSRRAERAERLQSLKQGGAARKRPSGKGGGDAG